MQLVLKSSAACLYGEFLVDYNELVLDLVDFARCWAPSDPYHTIFEQLWGHESLDYVRLALGRLFEINRQVAAGDVLGLQSHALLPCAGLYLGYVVVGYGSGVFLHLFVALEERLMDLLHFYVAGILFQDVAFLGREVPGVWHAIAQYHSICYLEAEDWGPRSCFSPEVIDQPH